MAVFPDWATDRPKRSSGASELAVKRRPSAQSEKSIQGCSGASVSSRGPGPLVGTSDYYGIIIAGILNINGNAGIHIDESAVVEIFGEDSVSPVLVR